MKLRNIVKILMDEGNILEVPGEFVEYNYNGHAFKLIVLLLILIPSFYVCYYIRKDTKYQIL